MSDHSNYYIVLGMSSNNVIESVMIEGYDANDVYYYLLDNSKAFTNTHPFIYGILDNLLDLYRKQYKMEPNLLNFINLIKTSDEFGNDFIRILDCSQSTTVNACSYYQNNRKVIGLKNDFGSKQAVISLKDLTPTSTPKISATIKPVTIALKPVVGLKPKVLIKAK